MIQMMLGAIQGSLASINLAALINTLYKLSPRNTKTENKKPNKKWARKSPAERFETINPYLQALTYSYSAYRLLTNPSDPVAYLGTGIAFSQLYLESKTVKKLQRN